MNVQTSGLSGKPHPVLSHILPTQEVMHSRVHSKMLAGDYPCNLYISRDPQQDPSCLLCLSEFPEKPAQTEDMVHLIARCRVTADIRARILPNLFNTLSAHLPSNGLLQHPNQMNITQFILDPTSLNLPHDIRISPTHPALRPVLSICRTLCFAIHKDRSRRLKIIKQT